MAATILLSEGLNPRSISDTQPKNLFLEPFFPKSILNILDLEALQVSINRIRIIPEKIGEMHQLKYLDLSNNEIQRLPHSIYQLPELSFLNVRNNPLGETEKYPLKRLAKQLTVYY